MSTEGTDHNSKGWLFYLTSFKSPSFLLTVQSFKIGTKKVHKELR